MIVWTIGHSTRSLDELIAVLQVHEIELVADVRRFPGSRRLPQFNSATLGTALEDAGIAYTWIESLGGRRRSGGDSPSTAWRNASFRAYADYTSTEEFAGGLFELAMLAEGLRTAVMCSEVLWWRCHRRIIADVLTFQGARVEHIQTAAPAELHRLAPPARIVDDQLTYAADPSTGDAAHS
jgi:uncharacterized protein (DUF488 family)